MVGASAGGLEAFTALLKALPDDTGAGFVLIQHLEPTHESALTKILSQNTLMPIREVVDGVAVEQNHVYVIPPNKDMTIRQGILRLAPREEASGPHRPIDGFAMALAEEHKSAAIGIVLSGTGSDGTLGLKAIKTVGGITFAQEPKTAQWPEMPTNAISAGAVDFVLPPKRIAAELARIGKHPYLMASVDAPAGGNLEKICVALRARTGVDFRFYKHATVSRRIARRMMLAKIGSLEEYVQFLKQSPVEAEALANDIFIHVTGFFRDPECFQALRKQVFRHLRNRSHEDPIRVWVPGCSTGEEVYSIAILLLEDLGDGTKLPRIQLFGTDVNESSIEHARAGIYSESAVTVLTSARLKRYFRQVESGYQVTKEVRDVCVFARHDLAKDPPFSKLDLISCRNVLIYMGPALQERSLSIFQYALKPTGFLFVGKSESVNACPDSFGIEDRAHRIFARKPPGALRRFDFSMSGYDASDTFLEANARPVDSVADFRKEAQQILIERYLPPAFIVDPDLNIIHFQGDTSRYLATATGQSSFHLLKMIRPELVVDLRTAIFKANKKGTTICLDDVRIEDNGKPCALRLEVAPIKGRDSDKSDFLVVFKEMEPSSLTTGEPLRPKGTRPPRRAKREEIGAVERELASVRDSLRSLIGEHQLAQDEMKITHEELVSTNEELQSTNEELETSKEELQSSNEELLTLNSELQRGNNELNVLSTDLNNLLVAVGLPVLVLDASFRIRRFTADAAALFNLIESDIGRPFSNIVSNLEVTDWGDLLASVARHAPFVEREIRDRTGRWYLLRMRPYRISGDRVDGAIVVLLDIDGIKRALEEVRESRDYARSIVETVRGPLVVLDPELRVMTVNQSFCNTFQISQNDAHRQLFFELRGGQWDIPDLRNLVEGILPKHTSIEGFEVDNEFVGLGRRQYLINACQISRDNDTADMILIAFEDITAYKKTEVLRQSASTLRALIESSPQAILAVSGDGKITQANAITEKVFGYSPSELIGQPIEMLISENLKDRHAGLRKDFFFDPRTGPVGITREIEGRRKDATQIQIEITLGYIDTLEGKLAAAFVTDITHRKMLERISETNRQKISALAASLLRAQEKERRRVSRELHDTLCQQLASLAFDVGDLAAQTSPSDVAHSHLRKIQARVVKMSEEVRHIAYQLHPSELDDLGLNAALQALCDEVSKRHRITIKVASNDVSEQLPLEVASCLYRVCQEGLNNMVKHSKAKRASVTLIEEHGSVALSIKDDGVGFRVEAAEGKGGLGMIGMKERARIVNGKLSIQTGPGKGTTVELVVPLPLSV